MKLSTLRLLTALIAVFTISTISASAEEPMKEYTFKVGTFKNLKVQDNVNVVYHCQSDSATRVVYTATPEFDDAFILTNSGNTLKIQVNTEDVDKPGLPTIHIYSDRLAKVENYSDFDVTVDNPCQSEQFAAYLMGNGNLIVNGLNVEKLKARVIAGNGTITISGTADKAFFRMTGAGHIDAEKLKTADINVKIFGGGTVTCGPEKHLSLTGIGSTKVRYHGSPAIKHKGGGKLIPLDND